MNKKIWLGLGFSAIAIPTVMNVPKNVVASDHDDGETSTKGRNVNLTDLYVFREKDQNASAKDDDLVFVMNTNPRSVARQQYYFSNNAQYEFHVSRAVNKDDIPTGKEDITLRFEFSKTLVGAYLMGEKATVRHALFLGLTTTVTHTLGVFILGSVTLLASRAFLPEQLFPWLSLISGLLVVTIGGNLLRDRLNKYIHNRITTTPMMIHMAIPTAMIYPITIIPTVLFILMYQQKAMLI